MKVEQFITPMSMNMDADERALKPTECRKKMNLRSGILDGTNAPFNENVKGTTEIQNSFYESGDLLIDSVEDISNDSVILFVYNRDRAKQKILRWFPSTGTIELILKSRYLNFNRNTKIYADVISGLLYWSFGYDQSFINSEFNPPRKINIEKAKKFMDRYTDGNSNAKYVSVQMWTSGGTNYTAYVCQGQIVPFPTGKKVYCFTNDGDTYGFRHKESTGYCEIKNKVTVGGYTTIYTDRPWGGGASPQTRSGHMLAYEPDMYFGIDWQVLDRIKYKPSGRPSASYDTDPSNSVNKLRNNLFQFVYRHVYDDNEKSVWSEVSNIPLPSVNETLAGSHPSADSDNVINVWFNTGPAEVKSIEVAVRKGNTGNWGVTSRIYKYDEDGNVILNSEIYALCRFYNNDVIEPLVQEDVARPFDFTPQVSYTQTLAEKNRLLDGKYIEGYDNINIDVSLSTLRESLTGIDVYAHTNKFTLSTVCTFKDDGQIKINWPFGMTNFGPLNLNSTPNLMKFEEGYTFVFSVDSFPYKIGVYDGVTERGYQGEYPDVMDGKIYRGAAVVYAYPGMTWKEFRDSIILQLRYPRLDSVVPAISFKTGDEYKLFPNTDSVSYVPPDAYGTYLQEWAIGIPIPRDISYIRLNVTKIVGDVSSKITSFKVGATHPLCLWYRDRAGRTGAALANEDTKIYIPHFTESSVYDGNIHRNVIRWDISHTPPDWATEYTWGYSKNITESYFLYAPLSAIGQSAMADTYFINVNSAISFYNSSFPSVNVRPYVWERGDRVRFVFKRGAGNEWEPFDNFIDTEILGQYYKSDVGDIYRQDENGDYVLDQHGNKIPLDSANQLLIYAFDYKSAGIEPNNCIVEIYRPRKNEDTLLYYQIGDWLPILNPHTNNRRHGGDDSQYGRNQSSTLSARGTLVDGDVYILNRLMFDVFPCESSGLSDFYDSEAISIGLPNIVNRDMRRYNNISSIRWSGRKIENTLVNELSRNDALDYESLAEKFEDIYAIMEDGFTLKVLQKNKPTSIFVGRSGLKQADIAGQDIVAISESVLGSVVAWENDYGTIFPHSIAKSNDYRYFYDIYNGCVIRWADNGMVRISDYGMRKYFRDKSNALLASGLVNVHVYSAYDKSHECIIISFVDDLNPSNNDTVVFSEPDNSWVEFQSFTPNMIGSSGNVLYSSANDGRLYKHYSSDTRNNFYGVQYDSYVDIVFNQEPTREKIFNSIAVHSNKIWSSPNTGDIEVIGNGVSMKSRLKRGHFINREGVKIAALLRDMFTSGVEKLDDLMNGRVLRGQSIRVRLYNSDTDEVQFFGVKMKSTISE